MIFGMFFTIMAGCSVQPQPLKQALLPVIYQTASTPAPSWVFGPSAPLPAGFPKPGPVGEIIIKRYPASRIALADRDPRHNNSGSLFMPLFHHIESSHIAMSAPVVMTYQESAKKRPVLSSMAFVYPTDTTGHLQTKGKVRVLDIPPMMVLSIGVRGGYNARRFQDAEKKLNLWLAQHSAQFVATGPARYLAYNSPFVLPPLRYGEVQIPISTRADIPPQHQSQ